LDPITLEVIRNGLVSVSREMGLTLLRTSYSPILNEGKDFSTAIFDRQGQMVAQMEGCPIHMASMGFSVKTLLDTFPAETINEKDVFILNDPYRGGMQHNDITLIAPVFSGGEPIVFLGVRAHHADAGGKSFGSFPGDATEQYQEGLVIPPMKYVDNGVLRADIREFILSNVRLRELSIGDLQASEASVEVGRKGIARLIHRYGAATVEEAMRESLDYSEQLVRSGLMQLGDGVYEFEDFVDNDGVTDRSFKIHVKIVIEGSNMLVDFSGSSPQVEGPLNCTYSLTSSAVGIALLMICDPRTPVNDGCMRPLTIKAPLGSVANCVHPAATCGGSIETTTRIIDIILGAMAPAVPHRICAGEFGTCHATMVNGRYPDGRGRFLMALTPAGGWGATETRDGWTTTDEPVGNCRNQPVEYLERKYPVIAEEYSLDMTSAGPGRTRGGHGHILRFLLLTDQMVSTMGSRSKYPPYGLFGGWPGGTSSHILATKNGIRRLPSKGTNQKLYAGERFSINPGGGGGYGDPRERTAEAVAQDVRDSFCDMETVRVVYGVAVAADYTIDYDETERLRRLPEDEMERLRKELFCAERSPDGGTRGPDWLDEIGRRSTLGPETEALAASAWNDGRL